MDNYSRKVCQNIKALCRIKRFEITVDDLICQDYGQELVKLECQDEIYASISRMKDLMSKDDAMKLIINAMNLAYGGEAE